MRTIPQSLHSILNFRRSLAVLGVLLFLQSGWASDFEAERFTQIVFCH